MNQLKKSLGKWGQLKSQDASEWKGNIQLPKEIEEFYLNIGPWGCNERQNGTSIPVIGESISLPPLYKLWEHQAGYKWNGNTLEKLESWQDEWLVIAEQSGDPFVFEISTGNILFAFHGSEKWKMTKLSPNIEIFAGSLCNIASSLIEVGDEGYDDEECTYTKETIRQVIKNLGVFLKSNEQAENFLNILEW